MKNTNGWFALMSIAMFMACPFSAWGDHGGGSDGGASGISFDKAQLTYLLQEAPVKWGYDFTMVNSKEVLKTHDILSSRLKVSIFHFLASSIRELDKNGQSDSEAAYVLSDDYFAIAKTTQNTRFVVRDSGCQPELPCKTPSIVTAENQIVFNVDAIAIANPNQSIESYARILGTLGLRAEMQSLRLSNNKVKQFIEFTEAYARFSDTRGSEFEFAANVSEHDAARPLSEISDRSHLMALPLLLIQYQGECSYTSDKNGESSSVQLLNRSGEPADFNPLQQEKMIPLTMYDNVHINLALPDSNRLFVKHDVGSSNCKSESQQSGFGDAKMYRPMPESCLPRRFGCILGDSSSTGGQFCVGQSGTIESVVGADASFVHRGKRRVDYTSISSVNKNSITVVIKAVWPFGHKVIVAAPKLDLFIPNMACVDRQPEEALFLMDIRDFNPQ